MGKDRIILNPVNQKLNHNLVATKKDVGLLLNFGETKVEIKRKVRELPNAQSQK